MSKWDDYPWMWWEGETWCSVWHECVYYNMTDFHMLFIKSGFLTILYGHLICGCCLKWAYVEIILFYLKICGGRLLFDRREAYVYFSKLT